MCTVRAERGKRWSELLDAVSQLDGAVDGSRVHLTAADVALYSCELCAMALAHAASADSVSVPMLLQWLSRARDDYWGLHGVFTVDGATVGDDFTVVVDGVRHRVVPVFVFDVPSSGHPPVLSNGRLAAEADGVVVAYRTTAAPVR